MSWEDDMERERIYRLFAEAGEELEKAWQQYQEFLREQKRFTEEYKERVCEVAYEYFAKQPPDPELITPKAIDKETLRQGIEADEQFDWYGTWMFESTAELINRYWEDNDPPGESLTFNKNRWPAFTEEAIEQEFQSTKDKFNGPLTAEQEESLRESIREDQAIEKYYVDFEKILHNALKKLVVDYFPMVVHIHSNGFLQIDETLHFYMKLTEENLYKIM